MIKLPLWYFECRACLTISADRYLLSKLNKIFVFYFKTFEWIHKLGTEQGILTELNKSRNLPSIFGTYVFKAGKKNVLNTIKQ